MQKYMDYADNNEVVCIVYHVDIPFQFFLVEKQQSLRLQEVV